MGPALGRIYGHQPSSSESTLGQSAFVWNTAARLPRTRQLGEGRPVRPIVGSTTIGMKSYVPSSRSIPSSSEHANVAPRIRTRADSFVRKSYTSGVTLSSPLDRHRTRIRAGGMRVEPDASSTAAFNDCRSPRVGARSNAFTNTAKPAAPTFRKRHRVEGA